MLGIMKSCDICGGKSLKAIAGLNDTRFGSPGQWVVSECSGCGVLSGKTRPSERELGRLYRRYYNFGGGNGGIYSSLREAFQRSSMYQLWLDIDGDIAFQGVRGTGRLLEVGCNEGRNLVLYRNNGFSAEGQDDPLEVTAK